MHAAHAVVTIDVNVWILGDTCRETAAKWSQRETGVIQLSKHMGAEL